MLNTLIFIGTVILTLSSCEERDNNDNITREKVTGYVQKGIYINGSTAVSVNISDLEPGQHTITGYVLKMNWEYAMVMMFHLVHLHMVLSGP